ncbi:hypothetical protein ACFLXP_02220 [Chloroflexota bacterium]
MEWIGGLPGLITALAFAVGIPLALMKRKKEGPKKIEQLIQHLLGIGIKVSLVEETEAAEKTEMSRRSFAHSSVGLLAISGKNVDYINVIGTASQYGVNYSLEYMVKKSEYLDVEKQKKIRIIRRKSPAIWGRVMDIEWNGNSDLSRQLNLDYRLKDILMQIDLKQLKGGIKISLEPKKKYARIKTGFVLPEIELFEAIGIVAHHIKTG